MQTPNITAKVHSLKPCIGHDLWLGTLKDGPRILDVSPEMETKAEAVAWCSSAAQRRGLSVEVQS